MTDAQILEALTVLLREVLDEDWDDDVVVTRETSFSEDLELESLELVDLSERMGGSFPDVDFVSWLSNLELDTLMQLSVGHVVDFIRGQLGPA
jgi:acyl carrier protein